MCSGRAVGVDCAYLRPCRLGGIIIGGARLEKRCRARRGGLQNSSGSQNKPECKREKRQNNKCRVLQGLVTPHLGSRPSTRRSGLGRGLITRLRRWFCCGCLCEDGRFFSPTRTPKTSRLVSPDPAVTTRWCLGKTCLPHPLTCSRVGKPGSLSLVGRQPLGAKNTLRSPLVAV